MTFSAQFEEWLKQAFSSGVPEDVKAFAFNLYEPAPIKGVCFGVELVGTGGFDRENPDWACEEIWEPATRRLDIPVSFSGQGWEHCLEVMLSLIEAALRKEDPIAAVLKSRLGIGVGFVDGDLNVVWP